MTYSNEELIEIAREKYPVGTKYYHASNNSIGKGQIYTIDSMNWAKSTSNDMIYAESNKGCLYHTGAWAEIVQQPENYSFTQETTNYQIF